MILNIVSTKTHQIKHSLARLRARCKYMLRNRITKQRDQLRKDFLISLSSFNHKMAQETTNLALHANNIHRQIRAIQLTGHPTHKGAMRRDLIKQDHQAMAYEESIFKRMEIRQVTQYIFQKIEAENALSKKFLTLEIKKKAKNRWIYYLHHNLPTKLFDPQCDYGRILYMLSILKEDLDEITAKLTPGKTNDTDKSSSVYDKIFQSARE